MKKLLAILVLGLLWCNSAYAEVYSCSQELSRYNRAGEIETTIYTRNGNKFQNDSGWVFYIARETKDVLNLVSTEAWDKYMFAVVIDKKTKKYKEQFLDIEQARDYKSDILVYGKCTISNY